LYLNICRYRKNQSTYQHKSLFLLLLCPYFNIRPRPSPKSPSLPPPTDHLTTLSGIIKQMLPAGSEEVRRYQEAIASMNAKFKIQDRLQAQYHGKNFKPRVHAELNLFEYFYTKRLEFVDDDRFIGCSKSACYCCYTISVFVKNYRASKSCDDHVIKLYLRTLKECSKSILRGSIYTSREWITC
jgi:hypothetical protein